MSHLCSFAELTGAHVYIVHTSCRAAVEQAMQARDRGVNVFVEAVAPHLVLDSTFAERPDFEGARFVMSPPLRDAEEHAHLWDALARRDILTIGTDHAPFNFNGQKDMGTGCLHAHSQRHSRHPGTGGSRPHLRRVHWAH